MTTPETINYPRRFEKGLMTFDASYEILGCSLNGLLWLIGHEDANGRKVFDAVPLKWEPVAGGLEPVLGSIVRQERAISQTVGGQPQIMIDESVARGLDWIMTKKWIFKVLPEAPYIRASLHSWVFSFDLSDRYILYSPHRHKDVNFYITAARHEVGGGIDPFTGEKTLGVVPMENAAPFTSIRSRWPEDGYCVVPSFDDWAIVEDFLVRVPNRWQDYFPDAQTNAFGVSPVYHGLYWTIRPLIPLEFDWSGDDRYPAFGIPGDGRGVQIAVSRRKLYAKGLLYMGEAVIMPAAFDELGEPAEYFLTILNTHGYRSGYAPLSTATLTHNEEWDSLAPILLRDSNDPNVSMLAGCRTKPGDPRNGSICRLPDDGAVLFPNGWYRARGDADAKTIYDPASRLCLTLGETGGTFFCGRAAGGTASVLDDYTCPTLSDWLAPAGQLESISRDTVIGTFDQGTLLTDIEGYFYRVFMSERLLPLAWGVFEKKQNPAAPDEVTERVRFSFGRQTRKRINPNGTVDEVTDITFAEVPADDDVTAPPCDNVPFDSVYRNPFSLRLLMHDENAGYAAYWWTLEEAGYSDPNLPQIFLRTNPAVPCVPIVYRNIAGGLIEFAWVDPESGGLTPASFDFGNDYEVKFFPLLDTSGTSPTLRARVRHVNTGTVSEQAVNVPVPAWLTVRDWQRVGNPVMDSDDRVAGLRPIPVPMSYPSLGTLDYYGGASGTQGTGPWGISGMIKLRESSSNLPILWKSCEFGYREPSGNSYVSRGLVTLTDTRGDPMARERLLRMRDWSEHGAGHYGASQVTDCLGRAKYRKTLTIWGTVSVKSVPVARGASLGQWGQSHLYIMRTDLDDSVFDFDAEMLRSRR